MVRVPQVHEYRSTSLSLSLLLYCNTALKPSLRPEMIDSSDCHFRTLLRINSASTGCTNISVCDVGKTARLDEELRLFGV